MNTKTCERAANQIKRSKWASRLYRDIWRGFDVFRTEDQPHGWALLERLGVAVRDGSRANLTELGLDIQEMIPYL